jgi:hypothetical protein
MNIQEMPSGTRAGWILIACVGVFLFAFAGLALCLGHKNHQREQILAYQLIAKFHETFNSASDRSVSSGSAEHSPEIQDVRSRLGKFKSLGACKITGSVEPPRLSAECLSTFEAGEAKETFLFRDYDGDNGLFGYSADLLPNANPLNTPTAN